MSNKFVGIRRQLPRARAPFWLRAVPRLDQGSSGFSCAFKLVDPYLREARYYGGMMMMSRSTLFVAGRHGSSANGSRDSAAPVHKVLTLL